MQKILYEEMKKLYQQWFSNPEGTQAMFFRITDGLAQTSLMKHPSGVMMFDEQDRLVMLLKRKPAREVSDLFNTRFDTSIFNSRTVDEEHAIQEKYKEFLSEHGWTKDDFLAAIDASRAHRRTLSV